MKGMGLFSEFLFFEFLDNMIICDRILFPWTISSHAFSNEHTLRFPLVSHERGQ